jgi:methylated-DNA-protein-cysteine methyltransferase-like protein
MEELLKKEKVDIKNDQVVEFKKRFWDPVTEIEKQFQVLHIP